MNREPQSSLTANGVWSMLHCRSFFLRDLSARLGLGSLLIVHRPWFIVYRYF